MGSGTQKTHSLITDLAQFDDKVMYKQLSTPGAAPASGYNFVYPKSDNNLYIMDSSLNEVLIAPITNINQITNRSHTSLSDIATLSHATIDTYLDQAVKQASSPTLAGVNLSGLTASFQ